MKRRYGCNSRLAQCQNRTPQRKISPQRTTEGHQNCKDSQTNEPRETKRLQSATALKQQNQNSKEHQNKTTTQLGILQACIPTTLNIKQNNNIVGRKQSERLFRNVNSVHSV